MQHYSQEPLTKFKFSFSLYFALLRPVKSSTATNREISCWKMYIYIYTTCILYIYKIIIYICKCIYTTFVWLRPKRAATSVITHRALHRRQACIITSLFMSIPSWYICSKWRKRPYLNVIIFDNRVTCTCGFVSCPFPLCGLPWLWLSHLWKWKTDKSFLCLLVRITVGAFPSWKHRMRTYFSYISRSKYLPSLKAPLSLLLRLQVGCSESLIPSNLGQGSGLFIDENRGMLNRQVQYHRKMWSQAKRMNCGFYTANWPLLTNARTKIVLMFQIVEVISGHLKACSF